MERVQSQAILLCFIPDMNQGEISSQDLQMHVSLSGTIYFLCIAQTQLRKRALFASFKLFWTKYPYVIVRKCVQVHALKRISAIF